VKIQILGTGCPKCSKLYDNVHKAVSQLSLDAEVVKVQDINEITNFGVMVTPALAIDGDVKKVGKVLSVEEIKELVS